MIFKINVSGYINEISVRVIEDNRHIFVYSPYVPELVNILRSLQGAKWNHEEKCWVLKDTEHNRNVLETLQGNKIERYYNTIKSFNDRFGTYGEFFKHQEEAFEFAYRRKQCMLALEPGLGKTLTCIRLMQAVGVSQDLWKWWLVAPFGAQQEWKRQLKRWHARLTPVATSTYESLHHLLVNNTEEDLPDGVIFDESIKIKNPFAQRSQIAYELCRKMRERNPECYIILLSGAPASKDPSDWWHQIECMRPGWLLEGDIHKFRKRYANIEMVETEFGSYPKILSWKEDELVNLGKRLKPIVLVKKKKDCLDLPEKIFEQIRCNCTDNDLQLARAYIELSTTGIEALEKLREFSDGFNYYINEVGQRQIKWFGTPKLELVKELLDFYHTENGGPGRLVIYAAFQASIDKLMEVVHENGWKVGKIDGRGWSDSTILDGFENLVADNVCIIANPACVHGITLSKTYCLCYYSNSFSVDARTQSLDRRDRPGADKEKATRIVDLIYLPTDMMIVNKLNKGIDLNSITLQEIKRDLQRI